MYSTFAKTYLLINWFKKMGLERKLTFILTILSVICGISTYSAATKTTNNMGPDPHIVISLVLIDLILLLALTILISRRLMGLWVNRQKHFDGSRLQTRIMIMFSLVSAVPTIIVATFSIMFFNYGIQSWFNARVSTALEESVAVADAYLKEHRDNIRADSLAMSKDLNRHVSDLLDDPVFFNHVLSDQSVYRSLTEALAFRGSDKKIIAKGYLSFALTFELEKLPEEYLERADTGEVVILTNEHDRVRALIKLDNFFDTYLLVGRPVDSQVLNHMQNTRGAVNEYIRLKSSISNLQIEFSFIFLLVSLLLTLAAMSIGILFASTIAKRINRLIITTEKVKAGDLSARVREEIYNDEITLLSKAFNNMTQKLEQQRTELIEASKQIDARRHFSETVIAGVSAGIIVLSKEQTITMINRSACNLLSTDTSVAYKQDFSTFCPEMAILLENIDKEINTLDNKEITIIRNNKKYILLARIVTEQLNNNIIGYIVTFDDVTDLITAQRSAAWTDIARRIAHEIKNPLTPIRLAAERIKRKYDKEVNDKELLAKYTNTIIRHVADIGGIVEEFVNFARMPAPIFTPSNICELINNTIFSRQCAVTNVLYVTELPILPIVINCDVNQIDRALTNIFKNAEESIESRLNSKEIEEGIIKINIISEKSYFIIDIIDNGAGFPEELLDRVTEPYVTNKTKGTGLGLAIVKKIIEDHNGTIKFSNLSTIGAKIQITLPYN
ncbi:Sensor histidine kinase [Rickettsiales bacterium Ac37b]|nr:Sensor histidine kinase [Rickettsiales bacterium Ac37b]